MAEQDYNANQNSEDVVVPIVSEELHADAVPVNTGSVRIVKRVEGHEEVLEQELRRGRVEVKRVKTNRTVEGPQAAERHGSTLVIPVVSEVLRVTKEWVVTEEIHVTQIEDTERVQERVQVNHEVAEIERTDEQGNVVRERAAIAAPPANPTVASSRVESTRPRKVLSDRKSILRETK